MWSWRIENTKLSSGWLWGLLFLAGACSPEPSPKPTGYFRIDMPERDYETLESECPYRFAKNTSAKWLAKQECWGDLQYPQLRATLQLTYKSLEKHHLDTLLREAHDLAYKHTVRAEGIDEKLFFNEEADVYGLLYRLQGNAATSLQFFATDSSRHFLRGVLYYYAVPNADSLRPVNDFMAGELRLLMETLQWQNS